MGVQIKSYEHTMDYRDTVSSKRKCLVGDNDVAENRAFVSAIKRTFIARDANSQTSF